MEIPLHLKLEIVGQSRQRLVSAKYAESTRATFLKISLRVFTRFPSVQKHNKIGGGPSMNFQGNDPSMPGYHRQGAQQDCIYEERKNHHKTRYIKYFRFWGVPPKFLQNSIDTSQIYNFTYGFGLKPPSLLCSVIITEERHFPRKYKLIRLGSYPEKLSVPK